MKRLVVLLISFIMLIMAIAGCSSSEPVLDEGNNTADNTITDNTSGNNSQNEQTGMQGYELPIVEPGSVTLILATPDNGYAPASFADNLPVFQEFEKRTGVKIEWEVYPGSEYAQAMNTRLAAASDLPDLFDIPGDVNTMVKLAIDDIILPIDSLIEKYGENIVKLYENYPDMKTGTTLEDGHIYSLPYSYHEQRYLKLPTLMIRKDWLNNLGVEAPKTIDDWYNVLKAFREDDPNENSEQDEVPLYCGSLQNPDGGGYGVFANAWGLRYGSTSQGIFVDDNDQVQYSQIQPEFKDYLTWMNKLYEEELIYAELLGDSQLMNQLMANNRIGATVGMSGSMPTKNAIIQNAGYPEAEFVEILPPVKDENDDPYLEVQNGILKFFAISSSCENPDVAVKWLDYFYASDEGRRLAHWGIEGETYTIVDGKPQFTDWVENNPDGLDKISAIRSVGGFNNFLMFRDIEFMKAWSDPSEVQFAEEVADYLVEPFPSVVPTEEEGRRLSSIMADIVPYEEEIITKFIMGMESLDNFDSYVEQMKNLGIEEAIQIYQDQYDRLKQLK